MILSRTSQYAIQALIFIATRPPGEPVLNREIASYLNVPPAYLAKIMQNLCKGNLLYSYRGRLGGFCLREGAEKTVLMRILLLTEGPRFTQDCVLGLKVCSDATACPMHTKWLPIKKKVVALLNEQTLEKLARAVQTGKYRLSDLPASLLAPMRRA
ncbi:MAG: Rrf2 family transcriptional regulator [Hydrogenophilales bacterium]|nr:Rrf2 family transcriptional regulator [Hydrogenophilales bacterium]